MGALLGAIAGLGKGFSDEHLKQQDERRQEAYKNQKVVRDALSEQYQIEQDPETRGRILNQMVENSGFDNKTKTAVGGLLQHLHSLHTQTQSPGAPDDSSEGTSGTPGLPDLPTSPLQQKLGQTVGVQNQAALALENQKAANKAALEGAKQTQRLAREQEELKLMRGPGEGSRPVHRFQQLTPNGVSDLVDPGVWAGTVSGADIEADSEHSGPNAPKIDHSPDVAYRIRNFPKAGHEPEYVKINNFGSWTRAQPDQSSPTGWSTFPQTKTGTVLPNGRAVAAPSAYISKERQVGYFDPNTGQRATQTLTSGPVGGNPGTSGGLTEDQLRAGGAPGPPPPPPILPSRVSGPAYTPASPLPQAPSPGSMVPPNIAATADLYQNDVATGEKVLKNLPKPQKFAVMAEVQRRLAAGEGPTPIFLGDTARRQVQQANAMLPDVQSVGKDIDRLGDKLGPVLGRWNGFLAGTVGSGDPDFAKLKNDISLIKSKVSQIHFGSNSGIEAVKRFDSILAADKMDVPTLKAGLSSLEQVLKIYSSVNKEGGAAMAKGGANSRATPNSALPGSLPGGGGRIRARDPQGVLHEAPSGTALPQGWKLEK